MVQQEQQVGHTPGPLMVRALTADGSALVVETAAGLKVATFDSFHEDEPDRKTNDKNAAHLVRVWDSHDDLLAALEMAHEEMTAGIGGVFHHGALCTCKYATIIRRARGEAGE